MINLEATHGVTNADLMLKDALENKYAIAHVNANNLEWTKAIIEVANETNTPVIIGYSLSAIHYMGGYKTVADLVKNLCAELNTNNVPIALHLDHGSYEGCIAAINAGFTSIMFDGSKLPFESNYHQTIELINKTKIHGMSLEAEIGQIGSDYNSGELVDVEEAKLLGRLPGLTCMAVGIGNIHGLYPQDWKGLDFNLLKEVHDVIPDMPLVLHGGTGIDDEQIKKAISLGIAKININTECQIAFQRALRIYFEEKRDLDNDKKGYDPRKIIRFGISEVKKTIKEKFELFGSLGVAK